MQAPPPPSIDRYFTEQIVGPAFSVTLGPSVGRHQQPTHGVLIDHLEGAFHSALLATRTAWVENPAEAIIGQPFSRAGLKRWRSGLLLGAWLIWSLLLGGLVWWWRS